jgi:hypothetical protein
MTQEEIIKRNKVIAEFMGAYKEKDYIDQYTLDKMYTFHPSNYSNLCSTRMTALPEDMLFNSSWDWLMPVVEKIESLEMIGYCNTRPFWVEIYGNMAHISIDNDKSFYGRPIEFKFKNYRCSSKIEAVFIAVSDFCEWYANK